jgi:hypothetical protein
MKSFSTYFCNLPRQKHDRQILDARKASSAKAAGGALFQGAAVLYLTQALPVPWPSMTTTMA